MNVLPALLQKTFWVLLMFAGQCFKAMALHTFIYTCMQVFACFVSNDIWVLFTFDEQCFKAMLLFIARHNMLNKSITNTVQQVETSWTLYMYTCMHTGKGMNNQCDGERHA